MIRTASERIFSSCGVEIIPCVVGSRGTWRVTMSDCSSSSSRGVAWHRKTTAEARQGEGREEGADGGAELAVTAGRELERVVVEQLHVKAAQTARNLPGRVKPSVCGGVGGEGPLRT